MDYVLKRWSAFTRFLDDDGFVSATMRPSEPCVVALIAV
jgi:hypothetical protein